MQLVQLFTNKVRPLSGKSFCEIFSNVTSFYNNRKENIKFIVEVMAIKMKDIVLRVVKDTADLADEGTTYISMVQALMIYSIQKYQYAFSFWVNAFSQSIGRENIAGNYDGKNITHANQQRLKRSKKITIEKLRKIVSTMKVFLTTLNTIMDVD